MTESHSRRQPVRPPSLDELTARYLATGTAADFGPGPTGEVEPYEVASGGFRAPARAIWEEALLPLRLFGVAPDKLTTPPEWAAFIGTDVSLNGLPMAAGLVPQQFRLLPGLRSGSASSRITAGASPSPGGLTALRNWVRKAARSPSATTLLAASGIAAVLGEHADAEAALSAAEVVCRGSWETALSNQRAAVAWIDGRRSEAEAIWTGMADSPVATFNRGMAGLFSGRAAEALPLLQRAAETLPDTSGWSHLAWVYMQLRTNS